MNNLRRAVLFLAATGLVTAAVERSASAEVGSTQTGVQQRLGAELGVGSAVGTFGITYQVAPVPWLVVEGGLGYGITGTQLSVMPKVSFGGSTCRFVSGFGASVGVGGAKAEPGHGPNPGAIPWLNFDAVGGECHASNGLSIQAALGLTMPLVSFAYDVADLGDTVHAGDLLAQGRIGVGWWF